MKTMRGLSILLILVLVLSPVTGCIRPRNEGTPQEIARRLLQYFVADNFSAAFAMFDNTMKALLPEAQLRSIWLDLVAQFGPYAEEIEISEEYGGKFARIVMRSRFARGALDVQVTINARREVAGLYFTPVQGFGYIEPAYIDRSRFTEEELILNASSSFPLQATLSLPVGDGPWPAVVLVHGSGPNDRDQTIMASKPFADLAWGLASRGVAVLRYDKRTFAHSAAMAALFDITLKEETVDDAAAAARFLLEDPRIDLARVYLLGHSLGGLAAPRVAGLVPDLAGLILLAAPARPLEDIMVEQYEYIFSLEDDPSRYSAQLEEIRRQAERVKDAELSAGVPATELMGLPASYWLDLRDYSAPDAAASLDMRLLVLQGERDYQVTMEDFALWREALSGHPQARFKSYPDLNHLFQTGAGKSRPDEYFSPGNVSLEVITDIVAHVRP